MIKLLTKKGIQMDFNKNEHVENIITKGYTILENVVDNNECNLISQKLDYLDEQQELEFGKERLQKINDIGIVRAPIEKDDYFQNIILNPQVFGLVSLLIRDTAILHLQNGVILSPNETHGQAHFHRDITFMNFVSDKIFSISALWAIDDFNETNGGTWIVPFTHKLSEWPSEKYLEKNAIQVITKPGSVIVFDSMLIHKGGDNKGTKKRRAINHMYTRPFIKQQIDFPILMRDRFDIESKISQVLGFWSIPPKSVISYRDDPEKRTYRKGQ
jgi:ectoine hydroxylase-related dioxygenase (phytanoyl-CoA dioxygenase family)